jgi:putative flippase GtrA
MVIVIGRVSRALLGEASERTVNLLTFSDGSLPTLREFPASPKEALRTPAHDRLMLSVVPHENSVQPLVFDPEGRQGIDATVEVVVPVYNEACDLAASIERLHRYLTERFPLSWLVTIADNASSDQTWSIACRLAQQLSRVRAVHLDDKGRGHALRTVWSASPSLVVAYMDVDLSTDLDALLPLVAPLVTGHSDLAIGTRLAPTARVVRGPKREVISRSYNLILKAALHTGFSDAQCGFKAMRTDVARALLPLTEDEGWFFDTELLVLAEHNGLRIHEVPVDWVDDPDTRVRLVETATTDLRGVWRMWRSFANGRGTIDTAGAVDGGHPSTLSEQLVRFASIGVVSTVVFAALFCVLVGPLGPALADVVSLGVCAIANTAANRRVTFALRGNRRRARHHLVALALTGLPLAANLLVLALLGAIGQATLPVMVLTLTAVNAAASLGRFVLLRNVVFRSQP